MVIRPILYSKGKSRIRQNHRREVRIELSEVLRDLSVLDGQFEWRHFGHQKAPVVINRDS